MSSMPYIVEVYLPDSYRDVWEYFESSTPFMAISVGDIINPGTWEGSQSPMKVLRVTRLEHAISRAHDGASKHKLMVYTTEIASDSVV